MARVQYLFDTDIVSQSSKPKPPAPYVAFTKTVTMTDVFLSVITIGEVRRGVLAADDPVKRARLGHWLEHDITRLFSGRILPVEEDVMIAWSHMVLATGRRPGQLPMLDSLIAATALHHGLTVVSRNVQDYAQFGVPLLNPFEASP